MMNALQKSSFSSNTVFSKLMGEETEDACCGKSIKAKLTKAKFGYKLLCFLLFHLLVVQASAQVAVTVTGNTNTTPNLAASYGSLANAITALNSVTAFSGPVTLTCVAGSETAPAGGYAITFTGTTSATNTVTITTSGAVTLTASPSLTAGSLTDAIFKLIGADWVTISGFTMQENAANTTTAAASNNMTEWGVALLRSSTTNGSQNNTIQNNTISLNRSYSNTFGIYSNTTHTTANVAPGSVQAPSASNGTNSFNKVYSNNISNVNYGIVFLSPPNFSSLAILDSGNDIGGTSLATGNTLTNCGGVVSATNFQERLSVPYCIHMRGQSNFNFSYNSITTASLSSTWAIAIYVTGSPANTTAAFTQNITNNTITMTMTGAPGQYNSFRGISHDNLQGTLPNSIVNITNNTLLNCQSAANFYGITTSSCKAGALNINGNIFRGTTLTGPGTSNGDFVAISNSVDGGAPVGFTYTHTINNNQFGTATSPLVTFTSASGYSGTVRCVNYEAIPSGSSITIQNNDVRGIVYNVTGSGSSHTYFRVPSPSSFPTNLNLSNNTFTNLSVNTTGSITFFSTDYTMPANGSQTYNNNAIVGTFTKTGASGNVTLFSHSPSTASPSSAGITHTNNNFRNIGCSGSSAITGISNTDGGSKNIASNTFRNWQTGTGNINGISVDRLGGGTTNRIALNTLDSITSASTSTFEMIRLSSTVAGSNPIRVDSNSISRIGLNGASSNFTAITNSASVTGALSISNNQFGGSGGNLFIYPGSTFPSGSHYLINQSAAANGSTITIDNNTFSSITTGCNNFYPIQITSTSAPSNLNIRNNTFSGFRLFGSTGFYGISNSASVSGIANISNNKFGTPTEPLTLGQASITNKSLSGNVATLTTAAPHGFTNGATVVISGVDNIFDGRYAITGVTPTTFTYARTNANIASTAVSPVGAATLSTGGLYLMDLGGGNVAGTVNVSDNDLRGYAVGGAMYYCQVNINPVQLNITGNTLTNVVLNSTSNSHYFLYFSGSSVMTASRQQLIENNRVVGTFTTSMSLGNFYFIDVAGCCSNFASSVTATRTIRNNIFSNIRSRGMTFHGIRDNDGVGSTTVAPSKIITGNIMRNIQAPFNAINCGFVGAAPNYRISGNTIDSVATSSALTLINLLSSSGNNTVNVDSNTVSRLFGGTITAIRNSAALGGILNIRNNNFGTATSDFVNSSGILNGVSISAAANTCTINFQNNTFRRAISGTGAHTYFNVSSSATPLQLNVSDNTFNVTASQTSTGAITFFSSAYTMPANATQTYNNNSIVGTFTKTGTSGNVTLFSHSATASPSSAGITHTNNNFRNIVCSGSSAITGITSTDGGSKNIASNTFRNWQAATGNIIGISVDRLGGGATNSITLNSLDSLANTGSITGINLQSTSSGSNTVSVDNNTISRIYSSGSYTGISNAAALADLNITNNTFIDVRLGGTSSTLSGILNSGAVSGTLNINNNLFGNTSNDFVRFSASYSGSTTPRLRCVHITAAANTATVNIDGNALQRIVHSVVNTGPHIFYQISGPNATSTFPTPRTLNVNNNTFTNLTLNSTQSSSSITFFASNYNMPANGTQTYSNNAIIGSFTKQSTAGNQGDITLFMHTGRSPATSSITHTNNNFSNIRNLDASSEIFGIVNNAGGAMNISNNTFRNWQTHSGSITAMNLANVGWGNTNTVSGNTIDSLAVNNAGSSTNITGILLSESALGMGRIGPSTGNTIVNGQMGTAFQAELQAGSQIFVYSNLTNNLVGTVASISSNSILTLSANGLVDASSSLFTRAVTSGSNPISIQNNTISRIFTPEAFTGILNSLGSPAVLNINNNVIGPASTSGATINGISAAGNHVQNIYANKLYDLSSSNASAVVSGILASAGTTTTIYNNRIGNFSATASTNLNAVMGLNITGGTTANVYYNTIYLNNLTGGATFGASGIFAATAPNLTLINNLIRVNGTATGANGRIAAYRRADATLTTYITASNNNMFYAGMPGANNLIYVEGTSSLSNPQQTLTNYKTFMSTRDQASTTVASSLVPAFLSTTGSDVNFLRLDQLGDVSGVINVGIAVGGVTADFEGDLRDGTPDIGADEIFFPVPVITNAVGSSPSVSGQSPFTGYRGQTLTITGLNFASNATISINGVNATVTFVNSTQLTAVVNNSGASVASTIVVTNPTGGAFSSQPFSFIGYITNAASDWATPSAWLGGSLPLNNATTTIAHTTSCSTTVAETISELIVQAPATLTLSGASAQLTCDSVSLNGTLAFNGTGLLDISKTFTLGGGAIFNCDNGTVRYSGSADQILFSGPASLTYNNLTLAGSGNKSLSASADLTALNVVVNAGSTLRMQDSNNDVFLNGDFSVNGSLNAEAGTIHFTGTSDQNIAFAGAGPLTFNNLRNAKTAGVLRLNGNIKVNNSLSLEQGNINTLGNILELGKDLTQTGSLNYTAGMVHGIMRRWFAAGTNSGVASGFFPMGQLIATEWKGRGALLEYTSAPTTGGHLTVEFMPIPMINGALGGQTFIPAASTGGAGFQVSNFSNDGYWKIDNQSGTLTDGLYSLALTGEGFSMPNGLTEVTMVKRVGTGNWFCPGTHLAPTGTASVPTLRRSGITGFSNFGFAGGPSNPLPVTLLSFEATCTAGEITATWTTASETNNRMFIIEQSSNATQWTALDTLSGSGNSNALRSYTSRFTSAMPGISYLRLVQIDFNGASETFDPVYVQCSETAANQIIIYPNAVRDIANVELLVAEPLDVQVMLYSCTGQLLRTVPLSLNQGSNFTRLDVSDLSRGIYHIVLLNARQVDFSGSRYIIKQ